MRYGFDVLSLSEIGYFWFSKNSTFLWNWMFLINWNWYFLSRSRNLLILLFKTYFKTFILGSPTSFSSWKLSRTQTKSISRLTWRRLAQSKSSLIEIIDGSSFLHWLLENCLFFFIVINFWNSVSKSLPTINFNFIFYTFKLISFLKVIR